MNGEGEDYTHCPMCGRHYDDHPACKACDSPDHTDDDCPLVKEYEDRNRRGDL